MSSDRRSWRGLRSGSGSPSRSWCVRSHQRSGDPGLVASVVAGFVGLVVVAFVVGSGSASLGGRVTFSDQNRADEWSSAWAEFESKPLLGVGPGQARFAFERDGEFFVSRVRPSGISRSGSGTGPGWRDCDARSDRSAAHSDGPVAPLDSRRADLPVRSRPSPRSLRTAGSTSCGTSRCCPLSWQHSLASNYRDSEPCRRPVRPDELNVDPGE